MPLHQYLREYFRNNRKFGSRDRKFIAELLYGLYRLGAENDHIPLRERLLLGVFLSQRLPRIFYEKTNARLAAAFDQPLDEKFELLIKEFECSFSFPYELSGNLSKKDFFNFLYHRPRTFIRIRQNRDAIRQILDDKNIPFEMISDTCFSFDANTALDQVLPAKDYVIQDHASQHTGTYFHPSEGESWWDCCTGSGGKSILLLDNQKNINLLVSDVRESILKNLHQRMKTYDYQHKYLAELIDLSKPIVQALSSYDAILCDVPCTGSGTWARSPEQYYFFSSEKLASYAAQQTLIATNAIAKLKSGGRFLYITCSLLKEENERIISNLSQHLNLSIQFQEVIDSSTSGGDILFISELRKP